jgi:hypothetical protein
MAALRHDARLMLLIAFADSTLHPCFDIIRLYKDFNRRLGSGA